MLYTSKQFCHYIQPLVKLIKRKTSDIINRNNDISKYYQCCSCINDNDESEDGEKEEGDDDKKDNNNKKNNSSNDNSFIYTGNNHIKLNSRKSNW